MALTLSNLRRYAVARSLFRPTTLSRAVGRLGFVQADPIRAPAPAQDLMLRHRVKNYHVGDLARQYAKLDIEEDFFVNYGFLPRTIQSLMHPRIPATPWSTERQLQAQAVLAYVAERAVVHPREVDAHFAHGSARNWFGGMSRASTQLLDDMHYRGMLRIAGRIGGVRTYAVRHAPEPALVAASPETAMDALVDVIVRHYAPLPERSLGDLISHLRGGAPQWAHQRQAAFVRARKRLASAELDGIRWYWPGDERPATSRFQCPEAVRLLAPFDPVVWDRRRFEIFWGWAYRFEAYTPAPQRQRGYYALPLLWRDQAIGWANLVLRDGQLEAELGYVSGRAPTEAAFAPALDDELQRMCDFLGAAREHGGKTNFILR
ncbi:MAG: YcaQ family DNA glycosylase [Rhodoferax sp.]|uniref:DNA glycosylase AlkZ-like family protein n=1 Tax=Rhodoferax sp. TaxID=50421 RepID=UPI001B58CB58|nr:crosslink repair DNA glycosylase YcaQ family protein [Rhodoferax sp.]MBP9907345.1 YcaQ family DNA glycosylase [Rhodoferax sp.]